MPGALSRFADFFAAPLFTEAATAREVAAIDSEHSKNLQVGIGGGVGLFMIS
jgi:insulysin